MMKMMPRQKMIKCHSQHGKNMRQNKNKSVGSCYEKDNHRICELVKRKKAKSQLSNGNNVLLIYNKDNKIAKKSKITLHLQTSKIIKPFLLNEYLQQKRQKLSFCNAIIKYTNKQLNNQNKLKKGYKDKDEEIDLEILKQTIWIRKERRNKTNLDSRNRYKVDQCWQQ